MQRKRYWWLPYVVLEFDKNEILIDAMGGDLSNPVWNYRADLYVPLGLAAVIVHILTLCPLTQRCLAYIQYLRLILSAHCSSCTGPGRYGQ